MTTTTTGRDAKKIAERFGTKAVNAAFGVMETAGKRMTKLAKDGRKKFAARHRPAKRPPKAA
ncbi:MAG TPA: hypothetical protein VGB64_15195 [Actinomycetota bacterium]